MTMDAFGKSFLLLFVLLNPFILSIYLMELVKNLNIIEFSRQLIRACIISFAIFAIFAWGGEVLFEDIMQVRFLSFQIFGGIIFLVIGIRLILGTGPPVSVFGTDVSNVSASIAMPFIVGPGTVSASVLAGSRLEIGIALAAIGLALTAAALAILAFKWLHDLVQRRSERYIERYTEIAGRATALFTGSFAVEMIISGIESWIEKFGGSM